MNTVGYLIFGGSYYNHSNGIFAIDEEYAFNTNGGTIGSIYTLWGNNRDICYPVFGGSWRHINSADISIFSFFIRDRANYGVAENTGSLLLGK